MNIYNNSQTFYFVRHGQTDWCPNDILKGPQDLSLNRQGIEDAELAAGKIKNLGICENSVIITSPLKRAMETAEIISKISFISIAEVSEQLKERYYGDCRLSKENPSDAESDQDFNFRIVNVFKEILVRYNQKKLIIVSHQKVFECISNHFTGNSGKLTNGEICYFSFSESKWVKKSNIQNKNQKNVSTVSEENTVGLFAREPRSNVGYRVLEKFNFKKHCDEMVSSVDYRKDPYTYIIKKLIQRGAGRAVVGDGACEVAMKKLGDFHEVVNEGFLINLAKTKYSTREDFTSIMTVFEKSLKSDLFKKYFHCGVKNNSEHELAISLYIFVQSKQKEEFYVPYCASDE